MNQLARLERGLSLILSCVACLPQADFLQVDVDDPQYADVAGVLLDPSCSGSGTTASRMDYLLPSHREKGTALDEVTHRLCCSKLKYPAWVGIIRQLAMVIACDAQLGHMHQDLSKRTRTARIQDNVCV